MVGLVQRVAGENDGVTSPGVERGPAEASGRLMQFSGEVSACSGSEEQAPMSRSDTRQFQPGPATPWRLGWLTPAGLPRLRQMFDERWKMARWRNDGEVQWFAPPRLLRAMRVARRLILCPAVLSTRAMKRCLPVTSNDLCPLLRNHLTHLPDLACCPGRSVIIAVRRIQTDGATPACPPPSAFQHIRFELSSAVPLTRRLRAEISATVDDAVLVLNPPSSGLAIDPSRAAPPSRLTFVRVGGWVVPRLRQSAVR